MNVIKNLYHWWLHRTKDIRVFNNDGSRLIMEKDGVTKEERWYEYTKEGRRVLIKKKNGIKINEVYDKHNKIIYYKSNTGKETKWVYLPDGKMKIYHKKDHGWEEFCPPMLSENI